MTDTTYRVRAVYEADTAGAKRSVSELSSVFGGAARAFDGAVLAGALTVATIGVGALFHGVTSLNAGAEEARISIAGLFQAGTGGQGAEGFNAALAQSDTIIQRMRVHANELPGEFRDLQAVFEGGLLPGLEAGKTAEQIEGLSATFMAVTQGFHIESQAAGRELQMLLEGRAGGHIAMWNHISGLVGKTAQEFNAMSRAQRFEALEHALAGFGPMVAAYGNTWAAAESTAKDHLSQLLRVGTAPLFERMKDALNQANHWFEANQASLERWATLIGTRIANGFDFIVDKGHQLFDLISHLDLSHVVEQVEHVGSGMLAARAGLSLLGSSGAMGAVGSLVGGGSLAGMGIAGLVLGPVVAAFATGAVDVHRVMHDLTGAVAPVVTSFTALLHEVTPLASGLGAMLVNVTVQLAEALGTLLSGVTSVATGIFHAIDVIQNGSHPQGPGGPGTRSAEQAAAADSGALDPNDDGTRIGSWFRGMISMGNALDTAIMQGDEMTARLIAHGGRLMADVDRADHGGSWALDSFDQGIGAMPSRSFAHGVNPGRASHVPAAPSSHMNVTVHIEQTINDASDPDRVVTSTRQAVRDAWLHPIESHSVAVIHGG